MKSVIDAANSGLPEDKRFPSDLSEKLATAVEVIKKVKP
jgi:hypothetical protein